MFRYLINAVVLLVFSVSMANAQAIYGVKQDVDKMEDTEPQVIPIAEPTEQLGVPPTNEIPTDPIGDSVSGESTNDTPPALPNGDPDRPVTQGQVPSSQGVNAADSVDAVVSDVVRQRKLFIMEPATKEGLEEATSKIPGLVEEDIGFISNGEVYVRAGYLKFGDIKGESEGISSDNIEYSWTAETSQKGKVKKPREIIVVGSKTVDKSSPKLMLANCDGANFVCEAASVHTEDELAEFSERVVNETNLDFLRIRSSNISMQKAQSVKLFGFIPTRMNQIIDINTASENFGKVKVKFPWWHFLAKKQISQSALEKDMQNSINNTDISKWKPVTLDASGNAVSNDDDSDELLVENVSFNFAEIKAGFIDKAMNVLRTLSD